MKASNLKLGEILIKSGAITPDVLQQCLDKQKHAGKRIGEILTEEKYISEQTLCKALAQQFSMPYIDLQSVEIDPKIAEIVPENISVANHIIPISFDDKSLTVAMSDPLDYKAINTLGNYTRHRINAVLAKASSILEKQRELYATKKAFSEAQEFVSAQMSKGQSEEQSAINTVSEDQPIIRFVNNMIEQAVYMKASDIHIEPMEKKMRIRFRIDGRLIQYLETGPDLIPSVTSRIKFIGGMNIAEKRLPQDGRLHYRAGNTEVDMRISVMPSVFGEKVVIRITTALGITMDKYGIGFLPENLAVFESLLKSNRGIILLTGATGSGKSTTLYTALKEIQRDDINIVTVENPVEMIIPGITQVDINDKAGLTFANVLRSILRQDPDIIMIGEIRDRETAEIASRAAITGHLVLSTLHTYSAASSVIRLVDMGVAPFMVTSAVLGVVAQRLVRKLCLNCREAYYANEDELRFLGLPSGTKQKIYREKGCDKCNRTGTKGRTAVHEIMRVTGPIRAAIHAGESTARINEIALKEGMLPMRENLRRLVRNGTISITTMLDAAMDDDIL